MTTPTTTAIAGSPPGDWRVICDFDGTITPFDITDAILGKFAQPAWEDVEQEWLAGKITARQCMDRQVRLIDAPAAALDAWLDTVPLTDGFKKFAERCKARGLSLTIVSDGLDYAIKHILSRHGIRGIPVIANRLRVHGGSGYRLEFPYGVEGCASGVCKCGVAGALGGKTLLVGDGRSDCCVAGLASLVLAKEDKELQRRCAAENYPYRTFNDFFDVAALLEEMPQPRREARTTEARVA
ncbi:MAG: MtnX-like HAD-IB family phosphatase [Deltaproteobacteria bacterium]|jgi:2,3-diketo-5-methylthio-1-phosphopentane phosphatase|nr:MtnX-like HAD-IB family phosphatase [Deltaproteobacteria bacterium]